MGGPSESWTVVIRSLNARACVAAALVGVVGFAILVLTPHHQLVAWATQQFSRDGMLTAEGQEVLNQILTKLRRGAFVASMGCALLAIVVETSERRAQLTRRRQNLDRGITESAALAHWWLILALMAVSLAIATVRAGDSFYGDELDTIVIVAPTSIPHIFGFRMPAGANVPGNHILMSLLTHGMLAAGFKSEIALRLWSVLALILLVPLAYVMARRLGRTQRESIAVAALVATSPTLARYGIAVRGYILAAFFASAAVVCYATWLRRPARLFSAGASISGTLAVLSNFSTLPIFFALLGHALLMPFDRKGWHAWDESKTLATLVRSLGLGLCAAIGLHTFMLPHLAYGSVAWSTLGQMSALDRLRLVAAPVVPPRFDNIALVVAVSLAIALGATLLSIARTTGLARTVTLLNVAVLTTGLVSFIASGQTGGRVVIYLVPSVCILLIGCLSELAGALRLNVQSSRVAATILTVALSVSAAVWSVTRSPLSTLRELATAARQAANGRPIWTSTGDDKVVTFTKFYLPELVSTRTVSELPLVPSVFFRYERSAHVGDAIDERVTRQCTPMSVPAFSGSAEGLLECPALTQ